MYEALRELQNSLKFWKIDNRVKKSWKSWYLQSFRKYLILTLVFM